MASEGNCRDDGFATRGDGHGDSFVEHDERMKLFRASHPIWTVARAVLFDVTVTYDARPNLAETGGSTGPLDERYWLTLIPIRGVTERRFVFN